MAEKIYWVKVRRTYEETKEVTADNEAEARERVRKDSGETIENQPVGEVEVLSVKEKESLE